MTYGEALEEYVYSLEIEGKHNPYLVGFYEVYAYCVTGEGISCPLAIRIFNLLQRSYDIRTVV